MLVSTRYSRWTNAHARPRPTGTPRPHPSRGQVRNRHSTPTPSPRPNCRSLFVSIIFGISAISAAACTSSNRPAGGVGGEPGDGVTNRITAIPRDLDPAVRYAASRHDMAVEHITTGADNTRTYELITIRNEPVLVEARSDAWPADDRAATSMTIEARVGRFGDADRERALVREIIARLRQLMD